jgi:c-di-GMP-binding flagellar brake protein YcgR
MEHGTLLQIETFSSAEEEQHRMTSAKEIEFVLRNMAEKRVRVALYYGDENDAFITTILAVDYTGLWLERSQNDTDNRRIAESKKLTFVGSPYQIKVQFSADQISNTEHQGLPAFFMPLPESIYRLQRREYFRLMTSLRCIVSAAGKPEKGEPEKLPVEMTIVDISAGGVGLTCTEDDVELLPGQIYPECRIDLPDVGTIIGALVVKNVASFTTPSGKSIKRAGCEFKNLNGASTILLQRYVTNMQRAKGKS